MRILNAFRFVLHSQRPPVELNYSHIFQPLVTESSAELLEIDFNIHKTNSSYFSDLDVSRSHLICTLFAKGIEKMRGGTGAYTGATHPRFGLALGAVSCTFHKEICPYQEYEMWSRMLCWDQKWIYIVTHFIPKGAVQSISSSLYPASSHQVLPDQGSYDMTDLNSHTQSSDHGMNASSFKGLSSEKTVFATAVSKCVFKSGRKTVAPETMLDIAGLAPTTTDISATPGHFQERLAGVEAQRLKGLKILNSQESERQNALEGIFLDGDGHVLGRHTDGNGIIGVVCTLLQLAGLRRTQAL